MKYSMGWLPDYPDFRDYSVQHDEVAPLLKKLKLGDVQNESLPNSVDLREWCSPVEDQLRLKSCTAHAGATLLEYFERRAFGKHIDASRLFLYKTTRNLIGVTDDDGADMRSTMGAMVLFGVPPEEYWPYKESKVNEEPTAFCYSLAQNFQTIKYMRLDTPDVSKEQLIQRIKSNLVAGLPAMFGFIVYSFTLAEAVEESGEIPIPALGEPRKGGHAVVAVGFDNKKKIKDSANRKETVGAFLVRNSWGTEWGDSGYGWLPYEYVYQGLAIDWWTLLSKEWIDTKQFGS